MYFVISTKFLQKIDTHKLIKKRPRKGIKILYERYALRLYNYAIQSWKLDEDSAWELVYQTIYKIIEKLENYTFKNEVQFKNFLYTAFNNALVNNFRKTKRIEEQLSFVSIENKELNESDKQKIGNLILNEEGDDGDSESTLVMERALDKLEDWERILVIQRAFGYSYKQISSLVDKPEEQLKVYYQRVKKKLEKEVLANLKEVRNER